MCKMCDGWSLDEVLADMAAIIRRCGWMLQGVESARPWTYTIGLAEGFGHPELLIVEPMHEGGQVLNELGERIRHGSRFADGDRVVVQHREFELHLLHPDAIDDGVVGMWQSYYLDSPDPPPLAVLQLVPLTGRHGVRLDRAGTALRLYGGRHAQRPARRVVPALS